MAPRDGEHEYPKEALRRRRTAAAAYCKQKLEEPGTVERMGCKEPSRRYGASASAERKTSDRSGP